MAYYNPFQQFQQIPSQFSVRNTQNIPQINPEQFRQFAMTLDDRSLNNFAQMARQQGISETDIQNGIRFIKSL